MYQHIRVASLVTSWRCAMLHYVARCECFPTAGASLFCLIIAMYFTSVHNDSCAAAEALDGGSANRFCNYDDAIINMPARLYFYYIYPPDREVYITRCIL